MKAYASHTARGIEGAPVLSRRYEDHVAGVQQLAAASFYPGVSFGNLPGWAAFAAKQVTGASAQALDTWRAFFSEVVALHDIGKLTHYFQTYLFIQEGRVPPFDPDLKGHTHFGALVAFDRLRGLDPGLAYLAAYLIAHHHRGLSQPGPGGLLSFAAPERERRMRIHEQQAAALPAPETLQALVALRDLRIAPVPLPDQDDAYDLMDAGDAWARRKGGRDARGAQLRGLETFFCVNYLFSLLIEADKLDASGTQRYERRAGHPLAAERHVRSLGGGSAGANAGPSPAAAPGPGAFGAGLPISADKNERRNQARAEVLAHLDRDDILERRLFTLTAPTGLGKTLTGLDFALRLRGRLMARGHRPQIIVALPFVNIVEQTLAVYEAALAGQSVPETERLRVRGHYQFADVFATADTDAHTGATEGKDSRAYDQARMSLDTWQADVVVTTFVQLFQSIATGRNAALKKFNHLAGAILILDEVQSLPPPLAPFIGTLLHYLTRCLDTRAVMMTATQPLIVGQANRVLAKCGVPHRLEPLDLLPRAADYFATQTRTRLVLELDERQTFVDGDDSTAEEAFVARFRESWTGEESQLVVVNTVNRSLRVLKALAEDYEPEVEAGRVLFFYLSTNVLPIQREQRIAEIKAALQAAREGKGPRVILVATQVVEAGVDLDFDRGWRDFGPVASLVQVAGRVNREGSLGRTAEVHVVRFGERQASGAVRLDAHWVYSGDINRASESALATRGRHVEEAGYLTLAEDYFGAADQGIYTTSRKLFESAEVLDYAEVEKHFQLIEESSATVSVYVPFGKTDTERAVAQAASKAYVELATAAVDPEARRDMKAAFETRYGTAFRKRLLNVPARYAKDLDPITPESDLLAVPPGAVSERYDAATGWNRDQLATQLLVL